MKILVIDDSMLCRDISVSILKEMGHAADSIGDARAAFEMLKNEQSYDVILTDYNMPGWTGADFAYQMRTYGNTYMKTVPIIGVTSEENPDILKKLARCGASKILGKPLDISCLRDALSSYPVTSDSVIEPEYGDDGYELQII